MKKFLLTLACMVLSTALFAEITYLPGPTEARVQDMIDAGGFATGTPVYVESDPIWVAESNQYLKTESDPIWAAESNQYLKTESDPIWAAESNQYLKSYTETDPIWAAESNLYVEAADKGVANGVATLDGDTKIPFIQVPAIAITDTWQIDNFSDWPDVTNALIGDVLIILDLVNSGSNASSYIAQNTSLPSTTNDWARLATPTDLVSSVNGKSGVVSISLADVLAIGASTTTHADWSSGSTYIDLLAGRTYGGVLETKGEVTYLSTAHSGETYIGGGSGSVDARKGNGLFAGQFTDPALNTVLLADGTYAVYVSSGPVRFDGNVLANGVRSTGDGYDSVNMMSKYLVNGGGTAYDWGNYQMYDNDGSSVTLDHSMKVLFAAGVASSVDWGQRYLVDNAGYSVVKWNIHQLVDNVNKTSIEWANREGYDADGTTKTIDWDDGILSNIVWEIGEAPVSGNDITDVEYVQAQDVANSNGIIAEVEAKGYLTEAYNNICELSMTANDTQDFTSAGGYETITNWDANVVDAGFSATDSAITCSNQGLYEVYYDQSFTADAAAAPVVRLFADGAQATDMAGNTIGWQRTIGINSYGSVVGSRTLLLEADTDLSLRLDNDGDDEYTWDNSVLRVKYLKWAAIPESQLGVLDLDANDGINPATDLPWAAGDTYRLAFVSSESNALTSGDIETYNSFITNIAAQSSLNLTNGGVSWKVIASTAATDARDNTSTAPGDGFGETVFLMNGTTIFATNYVDLWDGANLPNEDLKYNEEGVENSNMDPAGGYWPSWGPVWSGTDPLSGLASNPLTNSAATMKTGLIQADNGSHWLNRSTTTNFNYTLYMYGLSEPLTIGSGTPEQ